MTPNGTVSNRRVRVLVLLFAVGALIAGVLSGLYRLGIGVPTLAPAIAAHGPLMISGFLGTVISLERAIALQSRAALLAPAMSALATALVFTGIPAAAAAMLLVAPLCLAVVSAAIVRRQRALHTMLLAGAPLAWLAGNALYVAGFPPDAATSWWFCFLVLTIAAERLELTRLGRRNALATPLLIVALSGTVAGAALMIDGSATAHVVFGCALVAAAAWLAAFDLARRTVRMPGLARFVAVALLGGYFWLAVGGGAWIVAPAMPGLRDAAIHAFALGFVISMIFAHAPIVVPIIAKRPVAFTRAFYIPLGLLHASLVVRVLLGASLFECRQAGAVLNAVAIALFAIILMHARTRSEAQRIEQSHTTLRST